MKTAVLLVLLAAAAQDPAKPPPKFKAEIKLVIGGAAPKWTFSVEGTTDLPDGVVLKGRLYSVEELDDFKGGKRIDEESLIQEGRGFRLITIKGGKIQETLLTAARKPYSLWYRVRLTYDPDIQDIPILDKAGETELIWTADLHHGTPKEFEAELAATLKDLTRELEEVQSIFRDLRGKYQVWTRAPDAAAFAEWRKGLMAKVETIRKTNDQRYSIWAVWIERQAKFRFESFGERFEALVHEFEDWAGVKKKVAELSKDPQRHVEELKELKDEEQERLLRIQYGLNGFQAYLEEAREALGVDVPSDPDLVGAILKDYEAATNELAALSAKRDAAAWKAGAPDARTRARRALMKLAAPGLLPRRAYDRVLELSDKLARLYDFFEKSIAAATPPDDETAADHAKLLAEFRKYAGAK
jgi:hypothetical protein